MPFARLLRQASRHRELLDSSGFHSRIYASRRVGFSARLERKTELEYFDGIELEFRVQATLDVIRLTEAVLLARK